MYLPKTAGRERWTIKMKPIKVIPLHVVDGKNPARWSMNARVSIGSGEDENLNDPAVLVRTAAVQYAVSPRSS